MAARLDSAVNSLEEIRGHVIGIDLGTTYSCAAVWRAGGVEVIPNSCGRRTTPSYVALGRPGRALGEEAKVQVASDPRGTVYGVKRIIGRRYSDEQVQEDIRSWPFQVVDQFGKPFIQIGEKKLFAPEEISAMVVEKMIADAEAYLGGMVGGVAVTVPAYFNSAQREATKQACEIAGTRVLRVISEPTAAAIAYGIDDTTELRRLMVFDLGGGTLDVSLVEISGKKVRVQAVAGDMHLGGEDFDGRLIKHFVQEFQGLHGADLEKSPRAMQRLRGACEEAKRSLSSEKKVDVVVDQIYGSKDLVSAITRDKFEELCADLFNQTLVPVQEMLLKEEVSKKDIQEVVLVGGASRMPKVRQLLSRFFSGRKLSHGINPEEAVACGAAMYASALVKKGNDGLVIGDVAPQSLGIRCIYDRMSSVITRNMPLPAKESQIFTTTRDYQERVRLDAYEGEFDDTSNNLLIGGFTLENIEQSRMGKPKIKVTFDVSEDGIATVYAKDLATLSENSASFVNKRRRLMESEVERMVREAKKLRSQDRVMESLSSAIDQLEAFDADLAAYARAHNVSRKIAVRGDMHPDRALDCLMDWIQASPFSQTSQGSASIRQLRDSLQP
ncbi:Heat shock 70 kDa protein 1A [Entomophthora muscae]|uniref:Heat shock 70 kDa protein 1A n=1 Tax=Entomophthora muscae TaxID=34485 RepID=A0ACC2UPG3_9FUNG|nr:Heat shock 70 kDa protein 1A [Entomophthora muscae]